MREFLLHYVYIIHCNGVGKGWKCGPHYYKIGLANNLTNRLGLLQVGCPFDLSLRFWARFKDRILAEEAEKEIKYLFKNDCVRGEWFEFREHSIDGRGITQLKFPIKQLVSQHGVVEISESMNGISITHFTDDGDRYYIPKLEGRKNARAQRDKKCTKISSYG